MGISSGVSRNTLAVANKVRDWRIYADFAQGLIHKARSLYLYDDLGVDIENTVYALDSSTIDLCLTLFPWAHFRRTKSAVKLHTLLDLRATSLLSFTFPTANSMTSRYLTTLSPNPQPSILWTGAYLDFKRLHNLHLSRCFFVLRTKKNTKYRRVYSVRLTAQPDLSATRRLNLQEQAAPRISPNISGLVKYRDRERNKTLSFVTNNFSLPAMTIADLYRNRWHVELFFKWIKQHLRIKRFYGTSENAVKSQIWIAVSVYVLVAIIKKRLGLEASLYTILQILSLTLFEKIPLNQLLTTGLDLSPDPVYHNQLKLFN